MDQAVVVPAQTIQPVQQPHAVRIVVDQNAPASARGGLRWWHVVILCAAIFALYCAWSKLSRSVVEARRQSICDKYKEDTIAVFLHCHRDADACANTIMSLVGSASCPERVQFHVYQELERGDKDVFSCCMQRASGEERRWIDAIRIITTDDAKKTTLGSLFAWKELMRSAPKTKWTLITRPGTTSAVEGWDMSLAEAYADIRMVDETLRLTPLLTVFPARAGHSGGGSSSSSTSKRSSSEGMLGVARDWMNVATASGQKTLRADASESLSSKSIFTVLGDFRGRIPTLSNRTFPQAPKIPVETLAASSHMLFGPGTALAKAMRAFPEFCGDAVADYAVDWILSSMLYETGSRFFAPPICPFVRSRSTRNLRPPGWESKRVDSLLLSKCSAYSGWAGVHSGVVVTGRARMGLLPQLSGEDILAKYGSRANFDRIKRGFRGGSGGHE